MLGHNGDVNVGGHVWSNSDIELSNPTQMVMSGGRVWAWEDCERPDNIEMTPGLSAGVQRTHEPDLRGRQAQGRARPRRSLTRPRRRLAARGGGTGVVRAADRFRRASPTHMTLQPGVYYDGDEFSNKTNACDNGQR